MNFDFLKENADAFLKNAQHLLEEKEYKLSAFNIEQAIQLYLKYLLAKRIGDFPKTHSLKKLLTEAGSLYPSLYKIYEDNMFVIADIEYAYIASRYFPSEYSEKEVKVMLEVAKTVRDLVYDITR